MNEEKTIREQLLVFLKGGNAHMTFDEAVKDYQIDSYHNDLKKIEQIVKTPKADFYEKIPWGDGQNIFREILLVSDHTSYHIGEFAIMRQIMKNW